jgi:4-hydroxy-tetrahydrodipicolinate reductase
VDYTHPSAVNSNAEFYCKHELPFVMGTTGGNRDQLTETVRNSKVPAIIAPNMAKQIVGFQAMMEYAADTFPNLFAGYRWKLKKAIKTAKPTQAGPPKPW